MKVEREKIVERIVEKINKEPFIVKEVIDEYDNFLAKTIEENNSGEKMVINLKYLGKIINKEDKI